MKRNEKARLTFIYVFVFILLLLGCKSTIDRFHVEEINSSGSKFEDFYNSSEISPLKKQWNEMYCYVKKGHIQKAKTGNGDDYIFSYDLYKFLKTNLLKLYEVPFLQDYDNFIKVFGVPSQSHSLNGKLMISYFPSIVGDSCHTCNHTGFSFVFDSQSKKLLKE